MKVSAVCGMISTHIFGGEMRRFAYFLVLLVVVAIPAFAETLKSLPMPTGPYQVGIAKLVESS